MENSLHPSSSIPHRVTRTDIVWIVLLAVVVFILDLITKIWAVHTLKYAPAIQVIPGCLRLTYGENPGIAFGLLREHGGILHILTPIAFLVLLWVVYKQFAETSMDTAFRIVFGLLLGGALGNILNRLYSGYVIDFIEAYIGTYVWPTFNAADSALTIGEVILIGKLVFQSPRSVPNADTTADTPMDKGEKDSMGKNNSPSDR